MTTGTIELIVALGAVVIAYETPVHDIPQLGTVGSSIAETPLAQAGRQRQN